MRRKIDSSDRRPISEYDDKILDARVFCARGKWRRFGSSKLSGELQVRFRQGFSTIDVRSERARVFESKQIAQLAARILTYVDDRGVDRQVLVSSADGLGDIRLSAGESRLSGDIKLRKLAVRLHRSAIGGVSADSIAQLAPLAKTFLGPQLSAGLKAGFPYPLKDSINFIRPELRIRDGFVRLATDFTLNEAALREKVREAFERLKNE